jgi:hypothetical protein
MMVGAFGNKNLEHVSAINTTAHMGIFETDSVVLKQAQSRNITVGLRNFGSRKKVSVKCCF